MHSTAQNETGKSSGAKNEEPICRRIKEQEVVYVLHGGVPRSRLKHYDLDFVVNPHACLGLCLPETSSAILVYLWGRVTGENFLPPK